MDRYTCLIEGLQLLASTGLECFVSAEHDIIYAGPDISLLPEGVNTKLEKLGWHRSDADNWAFYT